MANRTPTNVLNLRGSAPKKNPARLKARENEPDEKREIGSAPRGFTAAQKRAWRDFVGNAIPGTLGKSDRVIVETASRLLAEIRVSEPNAALYGQLTRTVALLGMTPTERSKLNVPAPTKRNRFADD